MKESGASLDEFAGELDDYLKPGVSIVLERLPDCDLIPLDQYGAVDGRFVLPLPGLLLAFHERPSAGDGAAERLVRRRLDEWKDRWSRREEISGLPGGARGIRFRPKMLTGEKELVQPAAAFDGDLLLVATNEGTLRRALEARSGKAADGSPRPSLGAGDGLAAAAELEGTGQVAVVLGAEGFRRHLRDRRREAATEMIRRDPAEQRRLIHRDVALHAFESAQQVNVKDVEAEVDRRMEEAQRVLREVEFPRAVERYLHSLEPWQELRGAVASLDWDTAGFRLRVLLRAEPKR
jgi:hypothetical protein